MKRSLKDFFAKEDELRILKAIKAAEARTSGEIRVRVEREAGKDPMTLARKAFTRLGMRDTELRDGVLFVIAVEDRQFVILGDDGINAKVPSDFWNNVRDAVIARFREGRFGDGLAEGITLAGEQLATFFPCRKDDIDELPDAISYAEEGEPK